MNWVIFSRSEIPKKKKAHVTRGWNIIIFTSKRTSHFRYFPYNTSKWNTKISPIAKSFEELSECKTLAVEFCRFMQLGVCGKTTKTFHIVSLLYLGFWRAPRKFRHGHIAGMASVYPFDKCTSVFDVEPNGTSKHSYKNKSRADCSLLWAPDAINF